MESPWQDSVYTCFIEPEEQLHLFSLLFRLDIPLSACRIKDLLLPCALDVLRKKVEHLQLLLSRTSKKNPLAITITYQLLHSYLQTKEAGCLTTIQSSVCL